MKTWESFRPSIQTNRSSHRGSGARGRDLDHRSHRIQCSGGEGGGQFPSPHPRLHSPPHQCSTTFLTPWPQCPAHLVTKALGLNPLPVFSLARSQWPASDSATPRGPALPWVWAEASGLAGICAAAPAPLLCLGGVSGHPSTLSSGRFLIPLYNQLCFLQGHLTSDPRKACQ